MRQIFRRRPGGAGSRARPKPCRASGFTLLELLVAVTLLGLIATLITGGLRLGAKAWDVRTESFEQSAEMQAVRSFLRRQLAAAYPLSVTTNDGTQLAFDGADDALTFATVMPSHLGLGGFYLVSVRLEEGAEDRRLVAHWRLFRAENGLALAEDEEDVVGRSVLLTGIEGIELAYFGTNSGDDQAEWHADWREQGAMPSLISATVRFANADGREWPPLVVAPMPSGTPGAIPAQDFGSDTQDENE